MTDRKIEAGLRLANAKYDEAMRCQAQQEASVWWKFIMLLEAMREAGKENPNDQTESRAGTGISYRTPRHRRYEPVRLRLHPPESPQDRQGVAGRADNGIVEA